MVQEVGELVQERPALYMHGLYGGSDRGALLAEPREPLLIPVPTPSGSP
jgi:hypothetical protein